MVITPSLAVGIVQGKDSLAHLHIWDQMLAHDSGEAPWFSRNLKYNLDVFHQTGQAPRPLTYT